MYTDVLDSRMERRENWVVASERFQSASDWSTVTHSKRTVLRYILSCSVERRYGSIIVYSFVYSL